MGPRSHLVWPLFVLVIGAASAFEFLDTDSTIKPEAKGPQIVDHVTDILSHACLFDNRLFLRRMAFVSSYDGLNPTTFRAGYDGGIWQIDEDMFKRTINNSMLTVDYYNIEQRLHIYWNNVTWSDLRKPLYSGLAAILYLHARGIKNIPETVETQSALWPIIQSGHSPSEFYLSAGHVNTKCTAREEHDLVMVLDFKNLGNLDLIYVHQFLSKLLNKFTISPDSTRVGIVTRKKGFPTAGWYLNSNTSFIPVQALKYEGADSPVNTSDSLGYTYYVMFDEGQGGRNGSSKTTLLLTDGVDDRARMEARKLRAKGIRLVVVQIGGNSSIERLVEEPKCRTARSVPNFAGLDTVIDDVAGTICEAPAVLSEGNYTFPCAEELVMELPDTVYGISVKLSVQGDDVDMFSSLRVTRPDSLDYDVKMTSNSTDSVVLFVRGTNPTYVTVRTPGNPAKCTGSYTVQILNNGTTFPGAAGMCIVSGTARECSEIDMSLIGFDVVLTLDPSLPYLCTPGKMENEYFRHPTHPSKFIMCDPRGRIYLGQCPASAPTQCMQVTSGCKYTNPCTHNAMSNGDLAHPDPCGDPHTFLQCSTSGLASAMKCREGQIYSLDTKTCIYQYVHNPLQNTDDKNVINPCAHSHGNHVKFPFPNNPQKYIICDISGNALEWTCPNSTLWNQEILTCARYGPGPGIVVG